MSDVRSIEPDGVLVAGGPPQEPWRRHGALFAIVLLATVLRGAYLDRPSLFYDEVVVLRLARQGTPAGMLRLLEEIDATRAPLHPLAMQAWGAIFGLSALAGRSFSVLCGVLTVLLVDRIGRQVYDRPTGLWGAFLFAISPMQIRYAQEVRMYALLVLMTCLSWAFLFSFRDARTLGRQLAYVVCLASLVYLHPLGLLMVAALALAAFVHRSEFGLSFGRWSAIQLGVLAAIAPWIGHYLDHPPEFTVGRLPIKFLIGLPIGFIGGNSRTLVGFAALAAFGALSIGDARGRRLRIDCPLGTTSLLIWFAVPPLLLYAHSWISYPVFGPPRYTLFVGPACLLLVARGIRKLPRVPRYAVALACAVLAGFLLRTLVYAIDVKPDWRSAAAVIRRIDPGATVVVLEADPGSIKAIEPLRHYLGPASRVVSVARALEDLASDPDEVSPTLWVIEELREDEPSVPFPETMGRRYAPAGPPWNFPNVRLTPYRDRLGSGPSHSPQAELVPRADRPVPLEVDLE